jgi:hypothetical protein
MHLNVSHSTVKDTLWRELGLRKFSRRSSPHQLYDREKKFRVKTSVGLLALQDQYSELQFEGIATGDESCACYFIESDSMFARRREEVIPRLRPRMGRELLEPLQMEESFGVARALTGDESYLCLNSSHADMWSVSERWTPRSRWPDERERKEYVPCPLVHNEHHIDWMTVTVW